MNIRIKRGWDWRNC